MGPSVGACAAGRRGAYPVNDLARAASSRRAGVAGAVRPERLTGRRAARRRAGAAARTASRGPRGDVAARDPQPHLARIDPGAALVVAVAHDQPRAGRSPADGSRQTTAGPAAKPPQRAAGSGDGPRANASAAWDVAHTDAVAEPRASRTPPSGSCSRSRAASGPPDRLQGGRSGSSPIVSAPPRPRRWSAPGSPLPRPPGTRRRGSAPAGGSRGRAQARRPEAPKGPGPPATQRACAAAEVVLGADPGDSGSVTSPRRRPAARTSAAAARRTARAPGSRPPARRARMPRRSSPACRRSSRRPPAR